MASIFYGFAFVSALGGIASMAGAVRKAEAGAKRSSLVFYVGSVALIVLSANMAISANA